jgi:hypothetical protein
LPRAYFDKSGSATGRLPFFAANKIETSAGMF